jgi:hypothetical protein
MDVGKGNESEKIAKKRVGKPTLSKKVELDYFLTTNF